MKTLLFILLFLVALSQYLKADNIKEPDVGEIKVIKELINYGNHNFILCIEGYQWLKFSSHVPQQMFKENNNNRSVPVSCK